MRVIKMINVDSGCLWAALTGNNQSDNETDGESDFESIKMMTVDSIISEALWMPLGDLKR